MSDHRRLEQRLHGRALPPPRIVDFVSPYLTRPVRSLEEAQRQREVRDEQS